MYYLPAFFYPLYITISYLYYLVPHTIVMVQDIVLHIIEWLQLWTMHHSQ